jgi:anti-sigma regulatory factor (Ser/Thr protein kinase)
VKVKAGQTKDSEVEGEMPETILLPPPSIAARPPARGQDGRPTKDQEMTTPTVIENLEWSALPVRSLAKSWRILLASRLEHHPAISPELSDDIVLAASELITNAVEHAPSDSPIILRVRLGVSWAWLGLWDASDKPPAPKPQPVLQEAAELDDVVAALSENGRGLQIVTTISSDQGFHFTPPKGKWVWSSFQFASPPSSAADCAGSLA